MVYQSAALDVTLDLPAHAESLAYLPLAHVAERIPGIYLTVYRAGHVHACPDPTQVMAALGRVRPLVFFGVPRMATLAEHPQVLEAIQAAVDTANSALARVEQVKRFAVLPTGWTPESGELTPTLKLRRRVVTDRYAEVIERLYA